MLQNKKIMTKMALKTRAYHENIMTRTSDAKLKRRVTRKNMSKTF